jgi:hypothetical protein
MVSTNRCTGKRECNGTNATHELVTIRPVSIAE